MGPNGDRMQHDSDSSALVEHPDNMDCLVLLVAAAAYAANLGEHQNEGRCCERTERSHEMPMVLQSVA